MLATLAAAVSVPLALFAEAPRIDVAYSTFPEKVIRKGQSAFEWPFSIDEGTLACVSLGEQRQVFFSEILTPEEEGTFGNMKLPRMVVVTANPLAYVATVDDSELYLAWDSLETLIKRLAPYERMGWELCDKAADQPPANDL